MKLKKFEEFVNEEISNEFIDKGIANAKETGRNVSQPYSDILRRKNQDNKSSRFHNGMQKMAEELNTTFIGIVEAKVSNQDVLMIPFKGRSYQVTYLGYNDKMMFFINGNETSILKGVDMIGNEKDPEGKVTFFNFLSSLFKKYIPESKYGDRRIWSSLS